MTKNNLRIFVVGVLSTVMVFAMAFSLLAESQLKTVQVKEGGINIYVDNELQEPTDAKGERVYPISYNGTTYLPIRALTGMLTDKAVFWDGTAKAIRIGATAKAGQEVRLNELENFTSKDHLAVGKGAEFTDWTGKPVHPFNALVKKYKRPDIAMNIDTNREFSTFKANFVLNKKYDGDSSLTKDKDVIFSLFGKERPNGDYKIIESYKINFDNPTEFVNIDISNYVQLALTMQYGDSYDNDQISYSLHNITLVRK